MASVTGGGRDEVSRGGGKIQGKTGHGKMNSHYPFAAHTFDDVTKIMGTGSKLGTKRKRTDMRKKATVWERKGERNRGSTSTSW